MHVLLVEPSRTVRKIVSGIVEQWGHRIEAATDIGDALHRLRQHVDIRAVITSAELPSGAGAKLCADIRKFCGSRRPMYILVMSSTSDRSRLLAALDSGADDFLSKPPLTEELQARLRLADRMTSMQADLIRQATTDHLTGALTRRAFFEAAAELWPAGPAREPLCVLVCDLDSFKTINDEHGHAVGDRVLAAAAQEMSSLVKTVGRLGGEEFGMLCNLASDDAAELAEQVRINIARRSVPTGSGMLRATCSIGVAEYEDGDTIDALLRRADVSLYEAKSRGRNRVIVSDTFTLSEKHDRFRGCARVRLRRNEPVG